MNWREALDWMQKHTAEIQFQIDGTAEVTVYDEGRMTYWTSEQPNMDIPKAVERLDQALKSHKELEGVVERAYRL